MKNVLFGSISMYSLIKIVDNFFFFFRLCPIFATAIYSKTPLCVLQIMLVKPKGGCCNLMADNNR